ncbi:MAG: hypothetical protein KC466_10020 [Myxococcales bacterium]|nr:hypothetical protein [Myxococcales bacterium]
MNPVKEEMCAAMVAADRDLDNIRRLMRIATNRVLVDTSTEEPNAESVEDVWALCEAAEALANQAMARLEGGRS